MSLAHLLCIVVLENFLIKFTLMKSFLVLYEAPSQKYRDLFESVMKQKYCTGPLTFRFVNKNALQITTDTETVFSIHNFIHDRRDNFVPSKQCAEIPLAFQWYVFETILSKGGTVCPTMLIKS